MRGRVLAPLAFLGSVLVGIVILAALATPACGCQGAPAPLVDLAPSSEAGVFRVLGLAPHATPRWGDLAFHLDGAPVPQGNWRAERNGTAPPPEARVQPGDLVRIDAAAPADAKLQLLHAACNCYVHQSNWIG